MYRWTAYVIRFLGRRKTERRRPYQFCPLPSSPTVPVLTKQHVRSRHFPSRSSKHEQVPVYVPFPVGEKRGLTVSGVAFMNHPAGMSPPSRNPCGADFKTSLQDPSTFLITRRSLSECNTNPCVGPSSSGLPSVRLLPPLFKSSSTLTSLFHFPSSFSLSAFAAPSKMGSRHRRRQRPLPTR
jgi:hypothetical protein